MLYDLVRLQLTVRVPSKSKQAFKSTSTTDSEGGAAAQPLAGLDRSTRFSSALKSVQWTEPQGRMILQNYVCKNLTNDICYSKKETKPRIQPPCLLNNPDCSLGQQRRRDVTTAKFRATVGRRLRHKPDGLRRRVHGSDSTKDHECDIGNLGLSSTGTSFVVEHGGI